MHEVLKMLSVAMAVHFFSALLMLVHLWRSVRSPANTHTHVLLPYICMHILYYL